MSRFFVPKDMIKGRRMVITGKEAHHILDVMRLKVSDKVTTFDGSGKEYIGIIREADRKSLEVEIIETRAACPKEHIKITLIQALTKKEKIDYIIEKATELGVSRVVPVFTERTIPVWDDEKRRAHVERWRKTAREAAKQCGRSDVPEIAEIEDFSSAAAKMPGEDLRLIAVLSEETVPIADAVAGCKPKGIVIAIGPEGDFTLQETEAAKKGGFKPVSLGPRVLKSDTAGLAAIAILNYEFED